MKLFFGFLAIRKDELENILKSDLCVKDFILKSSKLNPLRKLIKGSICGVKIEEIKNPLLKEIRILDKLVDDLSKGKTLENILKNYKVSF